MRTTRPQSAHSLTSAARRVCLALLVSGGLSACSGGTVAALMPGQTVTIDGSTFTVTDGGNGLTLRNFETGWTPPDVLIDRAARAAQLVTGCPTANITKDATTNTYFATSDCPE